MQSLIYASLFVLPSVLIGIGVGFYMGRGTSHETKDDLAKQEREAMLKSLLAVLNSADQLTTDVGRHNSEIQEVGRDLQGLHLPAELEDVQRALLGQIAEVVQSNQRLEQDLTLTRHQMELQAQEIDETRREARTDALSGVANRKDFDEHLQFLVAMYQRDGQPFSLVLADVDHFKRINDTHGHQAGDRVVSNVGALLRQYIRSGDYVARFGGDEFAMLFPGADLGTGGVLAERIRLGVTRSNFEVGENGEEVSATFSMGVAAARKGDTPESIFARADKALYRSKESGRNQVQIDREEVGAMEVAELIEA